MPSTCGLNGPVQEHQWANAEAVRRGDPEADKERELCLGMRKNMCQTSNQHLCHPFVEKRKLQKGAQLIPTH